MNLCEVAISAGYEHIGGAVIRTSGDCLFQSHGYPHHHVAYTGIGAFLRKNLPRWGYQV